MDPPDHTRVRRLFAKAFTPRRIERLRPYIEAKVDVLLDTFAADGGGDFIEKLAQLLPAAVICHLLGIPEEDHAVCKGHSSAIFPLLDPVISDEQLERAEAAAAWFLDYFETLVEQRRRDPQDDLVSALLAATEGDQRLAPHELMNNVIFLFGAGHETTTSALGNGLAALLRHPDQLALLRSDPSLLPNAVLEMLRWDSPVQYIGRQVVADRIEIDGVELRNGEVVMGLLGAGNRDPKMFDEPDRFDISRPDCQPLSFGAGIHYCLGAALSRMETEVVFERLLARFPRLSLIGNPLRKGLFAVRSYAELPIEV
jgi:cytochrome P450